MSTAVATTQGSALALAPNQATWTPQQLAVVRQIGMEDASQEDLQVFLHVCQRTRLDPFAKQIYGITRLQWNPRTKRKEPKLTIQTGIDGFRLVAQRPDIATGKPSGYQGRVGPEWCGEDGAWRGVWADAKPPVAARVGVWKEGFREPLYAVAHYAEYVQTKGSDNGPVPNEMWSRMPANQLAKCAEAAAIRAAWPQDLSGIYAPEEMGRVDRADSAVLTVDAVESDGPPLSPEEIELGNQVQACEQLLKDGTLDQMRTVVPELQRLYKLAAHGKYDSLVAHISASGRRASKLIKEAEAHAAAAAKVPAADPLDEEARRAFAEESDIVDAELVHEEPPGPQGAKPEEPAAEPQAAEEKATTRRRRAPAATDLGKLFLQKGFRDVEERHAWVRVVLEEPGLPQDSALSAEQAQKVIAALNELGDVEQ